MLNDDIQRELISEEQLSGICHRLGAQITRDYAGKNLLVVGILKGCVVFMTDLLRAIDLPCKIDFMAVSSYRSGTTSGSVEILKDLSTDPDGYDLLIVEDILDSGKTLHYVCDLLRARRANSIAICTLMDKPDRRVVDLHADYIGMQVPDEFVVGYGLDYDERYRNLPYIGVLKPEIYNQ